MNNPWLTQFLPMMIMAIGVLLSVYGLITLNRALDVWGEIPRGQAELERPHLGWLRPFHVWLAAVIFSIAVHWLPLGRGFVSTAAENLLGISLVCLVSIWHVLWAVPRRKQINGLDPRLVSCARYTFRGAVALVLAFLINLSFIAADLFGEASVPSAAPCVSLLKQLDGAKEQWALNNGKSTNDAPQWADLFPYLHSHFDQGHWTNGVPACPEGGTYTLGHIGESPRCSLGGSHHSLQ